MRIDITKRRRLEDLLRQGPRVKVLWDILVKDCPSIMVNYRVWLAPSSIALLSSGAGVTLRENIFVGIMGYMFEHVDKQ